MAENQKTLARDVKLSGKGLHTGVRVNMTLKPAPAGHGIAFKRIDLPGQPVIKADVSNVVDTSRSTVIGIEGAKVGTIEHTMAAIVAMDLDNVLIEIDAPETPILDGSAKLIVEAIGDDNIVEQDKPREYFEIKEKLVFRNEERGIEIVALPDSHFNLQVMISFNSKVLNNQYAKLDQLSDFKKEISPCRTFVFFHELELLLNNNLVKGGDLDNAIVIMDKDISQSELDRIADLFKQNHISQLKNNNGILNNIDLHFDNEPARHKLLDLVGDLSLLGKRIKGRIIATRPGHCSNVQFTKILAHDMKHRIEAPVYTSDMESILDINKVMKLLPHRYPFLMVDKVIELGEDYIVGIKNITVDEPQFIGHFPGEPIFPGVLQIETVAQVGGLFILSQQPEGKTFSTYFLKVDNVKFRKKVIPGDTLVVKAELMTPIRRGIATMKGRIFVGKQLVSECEFTAQIVENK